MESDCWYGLPTVFRLLFLIVLLYACTEGLCELSGSCFCFYMPVLQEYKNIRIYAGAALLAPVINYRWLGFPVNLSKEAYYQQARQDQWALRVAYYTPWLTYWWNTQKWFPSSSVIQGTWKPLNRHVRELGRKLAASGRSAERLKAALMVMFGKWDFDPLELNNPFPNNDVSVHIWQGDEDALVPVTLQRYIGEKLSCIHYHELPGVGHLFNLMEGIPDRILKCFLLGEQC